MLTVKTPDEVLKLIEDLISPLNKTEYVPLADCVGRTLGEDVKAEEYVPDFDRSTVDGFAVRAADTFGCSESIPALLELQGEVLMGENAAGPLSTGCCMAVPTGGALPDGADAVVMIEYTERYDAGSIGVSKAAAPGENIIFRGDDVYPGKTVLRQGRELLPQDIGALAAMGTVSVPVRKKPVVGIISTGDELVRIEEKPENAQVRDVNSSMLAAACRNWGCEPICFGIVKDDETLLGEAVDRALEKSDVLLISGGSSVGIKDAVCRILEQRGRLHFHGIAMKPGKPTIFAQVQDKPVFGLPGHPAAAFFVSELFVQPLLLKLQDKKLLRHTVEALITESISANHGRAQYNGAVLEKDDGKLYARPIRSKSGLISSLAASDGYFCIPRDCEGLSQGSSIELCLFGKETYKEAH